MKIFKYPIRFGAPIVVPKGSLFLSVGLDPHNDICFWMVVDPNQVESDVIHPIIIGTGDDAPDENTIFRGTVKQDGFMWHIFT